MGRDFIIPSGGGKVELLAMITATTSSLTYTYWDGAEYKQVSSQAAGQRVTLGGKPEFITVYGPLRLVLSVCGVPYSSSWGVYTDPPETITDGLTSNEIVFDTPYVYSSGVVAVYGKK